MKTSAKLISALVIATATAFTVPAQAQWGIHFSQPWLGRHSAMLTGRDVIGINGDVLGTVVSVNRLTGMARLQTPQGFISIPAVRLRRLGPNQLALNMSRRELRDLARWG